MAADIKKQQEDINRQIDEAHSRLDELLNSDSGLSDELEKLKTERQRYEILSDISDQLEKLDRLGANELFWGENYDHKDVQQHQDRVRNLVVDFDSRVEELREKKRSHDEGVESLTAQINVLNEDTIELQEIEEELEQEFVIEGEMVALPFRPMAMPWNRSDKDQKKFRKILLVVLFISFLLGVLVPLWDIPIPDRVQVVEVPERLARLIVPKKAPPPPPPPPKEEKLEDKKPEKVEKVKKQVAEKPKKAGKKVQRAGLMAFKDDFADLIDDTPVSKLGAKAKISGNGGSKAKTATRSLLTSNTGNGSAGINTASLSRNVGGAGDGLGGVEFSRVESAIGTDFAGEESPLSSGPGPSRTDEEIQIVFDRYKAALYRIYNRQLRKNPTLQGKMVLRITIKPDGSVASCSVDSSDMDSSELDRKIAARVKKFNFGAKEGVPTITILYPIDFLPAT